MKHPIWILTFVMLMVLCCASTILAVDPVTPALVPETVIVAAGTDWLAMAWTFFNSPVGLSTVGFIMTFILGKVFTAKPKWKVYANKYKPLLIEAVKKAEKAIPDDQDNKGLKRLDMALKYVLALNNKLNKDAMKDAIIAVHAEAEMNGNLTKRG